MLRTINKSKQNSHKLLNESQTILSRKLSVSNQQVPLAKASSIDQDFPGNKRFSLLKKKQSVKERRKNSSKSLAKKEKKRVFLEDNFIEYLNRITEQQRKKSTKQKDQKTIMGQLKISNLQKLLSSSNLNHLKHRYESPKREVKPLNSFSLVNPQLRQEIARLELSLSGVLK